MTKPGLPNEERKFLDARSCNIKRFQSHRSLEFFSKKPFVPDRSPRTIRISNDSFASGYKCNESKIRMLVTARKIERAWNVDDSSMIVQQK